MSIVKGELRDFRSSAVDSDGGAITTTQIPATELSAGATAGATTISVHDVGGFAVNQEIVVDDGTNRERRTISSISGNNITLTVGLVNAYAANTPVATKNALLPDVTAQQANDGLTIFRKFFRSNADPSLTWTAVIVWLARQLTNAAISIGFGIDHADDNTGLAGNMTAFTANAVVAVVSDGADTRTITITGEDAAGARQTQTLTLNGATEVVGTLTFSRLYLASVSALDAARTVTIRQGAGGATRGTIGPNRRTSFLWFGRMASGAAIVNAEGGDIATVTAGLRAGNIAAGGNVPVWVRMSVPTGAGAVANNTAFVSMRGETA